MKFSIFLMKSTINFFRYLPQISIQNAKYFDLLLSLVLGLDSTKNVIKKVNVTRLSKVVD